MSRIYISGPIMCDQIYMLKGWEKSCGANQEYGYALACDMIIEREV